MFKLNLNFLENFDFIHKNVQIRRAKVLPFKTNELRKCPKVGEEAWLYLPAQRGVDQPHQLQCLGKQERKMKIKFVRFFRTWCLASSLRYSYSCNCIFALGYLFLC